MIQGNVTIILCNQGMVCGWTSTLWYRRVSIERANIKRSFENPEKKNGNETWQAKLVGTSASVSEKKNVCQTLLPNKCIFDSEINNFRGVFIDMWATIKTLVSTSSASVLKITQTNFANEFLDNLILGHFFW